METCILTTLVILVVVVCVLTLSLVNLASRLHWLYDWVGSMRGLMNEDHAELRQRIEDLENPAEADDIRTRLDGVEGELKSLRERLPMLHELNERFKALESDIRPPKPIIRLTRNWTPEEEAKWTEEPE